jgi:hypothetical protein
VRHEFKYTSLKKDGQKFDIYANCVIILWLCRMCSLVLKVRNVRVNLSEILVQMEIYGRKCRSITGSRERKPFNTLWNQACMKAVQVACSRDEVHEVYRLCNLQASHVVAAIMEKWEELSLAEVMAAGNNTEGLIRAMNRAPSSGPAYRLALKKIATNNRSLQSMQLVSPDMRMRSRAG